jgi:two-component system, OmpR family, sensor histidine kinase SenX3
MRTASRRRATITFLALGVFLAGIAVAVGFGWIILNWRLDLKVFLGVIFFGAITAGIILNTTFLLREIRRNEQHDSFINAVTHELKTPITSIRLHLQTLQRRDVDEAQRSQFYRLMLDDSDRLYSTVEQVLKAGEAGHKRWSLRKSQLDFAALVQDCVEMARARYHLAPDAMQFHLAVNHDGKAQVTGDPEELRTAISNVLDNAVKYSRDRVHIAIRLEDADEKYLNLSIKDEGVGIPEGELKRIFKRFYRVPSRSLARVKGTGLGLFIVRSIAKKHGGAVFAASSGENRGTTITLKLPRSVA